MLFFNYQWPILTVATGQPKLNMELQQNKKNTTKTKRSGRRKTTKSRAHAARDNFGAVTSSFIFLLILLLCICQNSYVRTSDAAKCIIIIIVFAAGNKEKQHWPPWCGFFWDDTSSIPRNTATAARWYRNRSAAGRLTSQRASKQPRERDYIRQLGEGHCTHKVTATPRDRIAAPITPNPPTNRPTYPSSSSSRDFIPRWMEFDNTVCTSAIATTFLAATTEKLLKHIEFHTTRYTRWIEKIICAIYLIGPFPQNKETVIKNNSVSFLIIMIIINLIEGFIIFTNS